MLGPTLLQIPVPKSSKVGGLNDVIPVVLTSVMKALENIVLLHLKSHTAPIIDLFQVAYWANWSIEDTNNLANHHTLSHLKSSNIYAGYICPGYGLQFSF